MEELGMPGIFHSGILFGFDDGSCFCRPACCESLVNIPGVKFALLHISWPWIDERLAVAGRFRARTRGSDQGMQMFMDITPGTPRIWPAEALRKVLVYLGDGTLIYGSDVFPADNGDGLCVLVQRAQTVFRPIQIPRRPWLHASFRDVCSGTPMSTNE